MATYLADKSALAHMTKTSVAKRLAPLIADGEVSTCGIVELEVLYSARSERDLIETRSRRAIAYPRVEMTEADFVRAEDVISLLAARGQHRAASLSDLLVAAAAERTGLTVIHYDADYDLIASVTRQAVEWVVERGSL